jgi:hypothetical protein
MQVIKCLILSAQGASDRFSPLGIRIRFKQQNIAESIAVTLTRVGALLISDLGHGAGVSEAIWQSTTVHTFGTSTQLVDRVADG